MDDGDHNDNDHDEEDHDYQDGDDGAIYDNAGR